LLLLMVHCGSPLSPCSCRGLGVQILLLVIPWRLLGDEADLLAIRVLGRIWRGSALMIGTIHVVVHVLLAVRAWRVLVQLHVLIGILLRLSLSLSLGLGLLCSLGLCSLFAHSFGPLLFLHAGSW
jgi:hypothetical protein